MMLNLTPHRGTVEGRKDALVKELRSLVHDADGLLKEMADSTSEEFASARSKMEVRMGEARAKLDDARIALTEKARDAADATQEFVRENPWKLLGTVAAAGLIIGFLSNRR